MVKKILKVTCIMILVGFSFFYTEKVINIMKNKDPIMIKINETKDNTYISTIKPIIINDEYYSGINGCEVDVEASYKKMKTFNEFNEELLVMKEVEPKENLKNKYILGGNKINKNVSIIFLVKNDINQELIDYLSNKKIKVNFFVDQNYLENNTVIIKFLSNNHNIYYLGDNNEYKDKYMIYANNLIGINSNNESDYCLLEEKNSTILKLCTDYNMKTIKTNVIRDNVLINVKNNLNNGSIITIDSNDINKIKVSINYILSKGYNIVTIDKLLNQDKCK